ncbi:MAG TPA: hypothetical protein ENH10_06185 [Bacteroidetes bacterium]|nr:hypothetical protein [Bacteroidota bacterium]HEX04733.1 hypothetical protein [Bacteroidota bacterium]
MLEGYIAWILLIPGLYFLAFGKIFTPRGLFEIPSDPFYVRLAGLTFILTGFAVHLDLMFGLIGVIIAIVLLIVSVVVALRDTAQRPPDSGITWKISP